MMNYRDRRRLSREVNGILREVTSTKDTPDGTVEILVCTHEVPRDSRTSVLTGRLYRRCEQCLATATPDSAAATARAIATKRLNARWDRAIEALVNAGLRAAADGLIAARATGGHDAGVDIDAALVAAKRAIQVAMKTAVVVSMAHVDASATSHVSAATMGDSLPKALQHLVNLWGEV